MARGSKVAVSSSTAVVAAETSLSAPPITPASAIAPPLVGDHDVALLQRALDAVERRHALAAVRAPDLDAAAQLVEVERVQRVAGLQHHVVGDVDQVRDGAHPAGGRAARASPAGSGPTVQAGDDAGAVARAGRRRRGSATSTPRPCGSAISRRSSGARQLPAASPKSAATSRAIPTCESASGRFGRDVDLEHLVEQARRGAARSAPAGASGDRIKIPSPASLMPSSTSLHSMPGDNTPRTSRAVQLAAARQRRARAAPSATLPPAAGTFGAPQTTSSSRRRPRRTRTSVSFSAPGCGRMPRTSATTTPARSRPRRSIDSTSSPASVSCSRDAVGGHARLERRRARAAS